MDKHLSCFVSKYRFLHQPLWFTNLEGLIHNDVMAPVAKHINYMANSD